MWPQKAEWGIFRLYVTVQFIGRDNKNKFGLSLMNGVAPTRRTGRFYHEAIYRAAFKPHTSANNTEAYDITSGCSRRTPCKGGIVWVRTDLNYIIDIHAIHPSVDFNIHEGQLGFQRTHTHTRYRRIFRPLLGKDILGIIPSSVRLETSCTI